MPEELISSVELDDGIVDVGIGYDKNKDGGGHGPGRKVLRWDQIDLSWGGWTTSIRNLTVELNESQDYKSDYHLFFEVTSPVRADERKPFDGDIGIRLTFYTPNDAVVLSVGHSFRRECGNHVVDNVGVANSAQAHPVELLTHANCNVTFKRRVTWC